MEKKNTKIKRGAGGQLMRIILRGFPRGQKRMRSTRRVGEVTSKRTIPLRMLPDA